MSQTLRVTYVTSLTSPPSKTQTTDYHRSLISVENINVAMNAGGAGVRPGSFSTWIDANAVAATGTVTTTASVANNATVTIGNVILTGKTGTVTGQAQWKCGVSANADATALAACINANTNLNTLFSAAALSAVVTITCIGTVSGSTLGAIGNMIILASSDGTNLAVVAFSGGVNDSGFIVYTL